MAGFIRANSAWTTVQKGFVYANGAWRSVQKGFVYANSAWRQFFPGGLTPVIAAQVTIAKSGSGTVTLTGTNRRWTNFSTGVYFFDRNNEYSVGEFGDNIIFAKINSDMAFNNILLKKEWSRLANKLKDSPEYFYKDSLSDFINQYNIEKDIK